MAKITIEGSLTPSARLARGERLEVQDSDEVRKFVADGFAVVVDAETGEAEPTPLPEAPKAPAKSASREKWVEFADGQDGFEYDADATRDEIAEAWAAHVARGGEVTATEE
ncbi:hypothetical protein PBI_INDLOVU_22 [Mycobacterium phage Indlovu]|nr:hypothetical protein PBI_INDLOVU_22 [Mycobacterium phage Indlovu]